VSVDCEFISEEPFIDVMIQQLIVEAMQSDSLEFLGAYLLLLSFREVFGSILVDTCEELIEVAEIVRIGCEFSAEVLIVGRGGICILLLEEEWCSLRSLLQLSHEIFNIQ
jgi:hypothetical protein